MKVKITLLVICQDSSMADSDMRRISILLDDSHEIPSKYLIGDDEGKILRDISDKYLNFSYDWLIKTLAGFRCLDQQTCEVCYITVVPKMQDSNKLGKFHNQTELEGIELDSYYEQLISKFGTSRFR
mgnify:FL=1|tara:strand:+ start:299 stop:679 length:381 start_codon:yes stop_codon:yes gene_type:complete